MEAYGATGTVFGHHGYGHQNYQQTPGGGILVPVLRAPPGLPSPALPLCTRCTFPCASSAGEALVLPGFGSFSCMHSPHAGQPGASRGVPKSRRRRTPFVLLSYLIVRIGDRTSRGHYPHTIPVALSAHLPDVCGYKQRYSSTLAGIWLRPQAPGFAEEVSWTDRTWTQLPDMYADIRKAIPSSLVVYGWEALYTPACEM